MLKQIDLFTFSKICIIFSYLEEKYPATSTIYDNYDPKSQGEKTHLPLSVTHRINKVHKINMLCFTGDEYRYFLPLWLITP